MVKLNPETANMHIDNMKRKMKIEEDDDFLDQFLMSGPKINSNIAGGEKKKINLPFGQKTLNFLQASKQKKIVNDDSDEEDELYKF